MTRSATHDFTDFKGITALVTGASAGIGEAFARELAREGADLILVARSKDKLHALSADLKRAHRIEAHVFPADLRFQETPRQLFEDIRNAGLEVDLLVNNAGIGRYGCFEEVESEKDDAMIAVNVNSLVALTHFFLPSMLQKGKGGILNVASTAAFQPIPYLALYSATKSFVVSFSEALWEEYRRRGIRVLCLCPGYTDTDFHRTAGADAKRVVYIATAEAVARFGLREFKETNRPTAIYGFWNRFFSHGHRFVSRALAARVAGRLFRPRLAKRVTQPKEV